VGTAAVTVGGPGATGSATGVWAPLGACAAPVLPAGVGLTAAGDDVEAEAWAIVPRGVVVATTLGLETRAASFATQLHANRRRATASAG
jgi:hypothetical protein